MERVERNLPRSRERLPPAPSGDEVALRRDLLEQRRAVEEDLVQVREVAVLGEPQELDGERLDRGDCQRLELVYSVARVEAGQGLPPAESAGDATQQRLPPEVERSDLEAAPLKLCRPLGREHYAVPVAKTSAIDLTFTEAPLPWM